MASTKGLAHFYSRDELVDLLNAEGENARLLQQAADALRKEVMGDAVHLRGIIEFSNICKNRCRYCGIRNGNSIVPRYRISDDEIVAAAHDVKSRGCGTVVLQSGEDSYYTADRLCALLRRIRRETGLAITLSVGIRSFEELKALHQAGADRYLLRFETCDPEMFEKIHPDAGFAARIQCLEDLRNAGYQLGSGFMIGLPDTGAGEIADNLLYTQKLRLDMIGCGPFLANPQTPMSVQPQFPHTIYYNTISLVRLMNPYAHIPATTAFDALEPDGRTHVLECGANVFMPNMTPWRFRKLYRLYPNKPGADEEGSETLAASRARLTAIGRTIAEGPGDALRAGGLGG